MVQRTVRRTGVVIILVLLMILVLLAVICWYVAETHTVRTVYVEGNIHYTEEEIKKMVMNGFLGNNSLYLSMKYKNRGIKDVPFVDEMDVNVLAPDTIKIKVYEKALAGYVKYMDTYVYFDKDGYVIESSSIRTAGIPQVTGLEFDHVVLGQPLPVGDGQKDVFGMLLNLTKLLNKYELSADKIYFQSGSDVLLYFGEVRVVLGDDSDSMEDKVMLLPEFLASLSGKSGTLRMETYAGGSREYTFKPD